MELDQVFGLATGAMERVVDMFGVATLELGDDKADIEAERGLDARDNPAIGCAPALGRIAGLGIAAQHRQPAGGTVDADRIGGSDHYARRVLVGDKLAGERDALLLRQLARDGELDLPTELRVLSLLGRLDFVPQGLPGAQPLGRSGGQHHLGMDDADLVREVVVTVEPLVVQLWRRAAGGRRHRARAGAAANDFCREVVDRHDGVEITRGPAKTVRRLSALMR